MGLFDINFSNVVRNILPNRRRTPRMIAFLTACARPFQWLRDSWFVDYDLRSAAAAYDNSTTYNHGDKVLYSDGAVFECQTDNTTGIPPDPANVPSVWQIVSTDYRGVQNRILYNSQRLNIEYVLNEYFTTAFVQPPGTSDIYIESNELNNFAFVVGGTEIISSSVFALDFYCSNFIIDDYDFIENAFTIYVPSATYAAISPGADAKIRAVADTMVIAGMKYDIQTY